MRETVNCIKRILFQLRWVFMSQEQRYVYLWNRTKGRKQTPAWVIDKVSVSRDDELFNGLILLNEGMSATENARY